VNESHASAEQIIAAAKTLAERVHQGQKRKYSGEDYINHPRRVADAVGSPIEKAVAWLHDVLEDAPDRQMVRQALMQFPPEMEAAVQALTRQEKESYEQFIERVAKNRLATVVKLADLRDNLRDLESRELKERYLKALDRLEKVVRYGNEHNTKTSEQGRSPARLCTDAEPPVCGLS
jgi:(p)ppGpp synthase/HD superfamily hydrolase